MEYEKLEITLHSAKGLFDVKHLGTMNPYAIVWIAGDGQESKPHTTVVATKGGSSPIWNYHMQFDVVPMHTYYSLFCEIKHDGTLFDREIGKVQVPFADLVAGNGSGEKLSYPVTIYSGEVNGEIILSHKFSKPIEKNGDGAGSGSGGKEGHGGPRNKVPRKKQIGMLKGIAGNVASGLIIKGVIMAASTALGAGGLTFGLEDALDHQGEDGVEEYGEDEYGVEEYGEDEYGEDEYIYEDQY